MTCLRATGLGPEAIFSFYFMPFFFSFVFFVFGQFPSIKHNQLAAQVIIFCWPSVCSANVPLKMPQNFSHGRVWGFWHCHFHKQIPSALPAPWIAWTCQPRVSAAWWLVAGGCINIPNLRPIKINSPAQTGQKIGSYWSFVYLHFLPRETEVRMSVAHCLKRKWKR